MSTVTVYARAPTRAAGLAFMAATGVAEEVDGKVRAKVQAHIFTTDDFPQPTRLTGNMVTNELGDLVPEKVPLSGWFANIKYYGSSAEALAQGGDPSAVDLFERFPGLLVLSKVRTGKPMNWVALPGDPTPPGYENEDGIRLYDPAFISTPANVIA